MAHSLTSFRSLHKYRSQWGLTWGPQSIQHHFLFYLPSFISLHSMYCHETIYLLTSYLSYPLRMSSSGRYGVCLFDHHCAPNAWNSVCHIVYYCMIEGMNTFKSVVHNVGLFYIILTPLRASLSCSFDRHSYEVVPHCKQELKISALGKWLFCSSR